MLRREFISRAGAFAVAGAFLPTDRASAAAPAAIVDAHCHIFNGDDLPVVGFMEKVVLPQQPEFKDYVTQYGHVIRFFVRFLTDSLREKTKTAHDEVGVLDEIKAGTKTPRSQGAIRQADVDLLTEIIENLRNVHINGRAFPFREGLVSYYLPAIVIGNLHREAYPAIYKHKGLDNIDGEFDWQTWRSSGDLAADVYRDGRGPLSHYLRWALLFTHYRYEIADELARIHGNSVRLLLPALVDYSNWLNDPYDVKLSAQVTVMGRIARRKGSIRVHGYAPFDPLREALHRYNNLTTESPLALVKRAVAEEGFIGVKLYPPMGFLPYQNKPTLSAGDYPAHLDKGFRKTMSGALDAVLADLYSWCVAEQVPVLAHAANSNGAEPDYSARANPDNWAAVAKAFPGIRLSLAHFGDFELGFAKPNRPKPKLEATWEWKMAKLSQSNPQSLIYIDMSYLQRAMLNADNGQRKEIQRMLDEMRGNFTGLGDRLLFGTDWLMFGRELGFPAFDRDGRYAERVGDVLRAAEFDQPARDRIMSSNAGNFLGLNLPETAHGNRARLKQFYAKHGLDDSWLNGFPVA